MKTAFQPRMLLAPVALGFGLLLGAVASANNQQQTQNQTQTQNSQSTPLYLQNQQREQEREQERQRTQVNPSQTGSHLLIQTRTRERERDQARISDTIGTYFHRFQSRSEQLMRMQQLHRRVMNYLSDGIAGTPRYYMELIRQHLESMIDDMDG